MKESKICELHYCLLHYFIPKLIDQTSIIEYMN